MERGFKSWCESTSLAYRKEIGLRPFDSLDPWKLAKHLAVKVWKVEDIPGIEQRHLRTLTIGDKDSWSAATLSLPAIRLIILNSGHGHGRMQSDLMHELAHIIIGHEASMIDISEDNLLLLNTYDKLQEEEANWLAGCLLLPRKSLEYIKRKGFDQAQICSQYGVSKVMYDYRVRITGVNRQYSYHKGYW